MSTETHVCGYCEETEMDEPWGKCQSCREAEHARYEELDELFDETFEGHEVFEGATRSQQNTVKRAWLACWRNAAGHDLAFMEKKEIKLLDLHRSEYNPRRLTLRLAVGNEDENTIGALYPTRGQVFIGPRGGASFFKEGNKNATHGRGKLFAAFRSR